MTPEQLLQPRYKVAGPYPLSPYKVGDLVSIMDGRFHLVTIHNRNEFGGRDETEVYVPLSTIKEYTNLFRPMEWHEERKPEDMPQYVKNKKGNVLRVLGPECNGRIFGHEPNTIEHRFIWPYAAGFLPATEEEYNTYLNSK